MMITINIDEIQKTTTKALVGIWSRGTIIAEFPGIDPAGEWMRKAEPELDLRARVYYRWEWERKHR